MTTGNHSHGADMTGKDFTRELLAAAVTLGLAWYLSEPRPDPNAAFWFYTHKYARKFADYSGDKYMKIVGAYFNG